MTNQDQDRTCTRQTLEQVIAQHGGVLTTGCHDASADGPCCIMEARAVCLGLEWTDEPSVVGMPDIRPLNDARWSSDTARTEWMLKLADAYTNWATWSRERQQAVISRVVIGTVQHVIAELSPVPDAIRTRCRAVRTLDEAADAAAAAGAGAAEADAAWAAWAAEAAAGAAEADAAGAARAAAWAARAAADQMLITACQVWIDATTTTTT